MSNKLDCPLLFGLRNVEWQAMWAAELADLLEVTHLEHSARQQGLLRTLATASSSCPVRSASVPHLAAYFSLCEWPPAAQCRLPVVVRIDGPVSHVVAAIERPVAAPPLTGEGTD